MSATGRCLLTAVLALVCSLVRPIAAQQDGSFTPQITFRSSVDLVSVTAVVRDRHGRVVPSLTRDDFEILDGGQRRSVIDLQSDQASPASVALLVDGSGSMRLGTALASSRHISGAVLDSLDPRRDDAALFSFDTRLLTLRAFTRDLERVRRGLDEVASFGSTSLYDAIAGTAGSVAGRTQNRRAVIVLTDGADTTSSYTPEEVSWIASTIDVPIYIFSLASPSNVAPIASRTSPVLTSPLADLARATGGELFVAESPALISLGIRRLLEELRHQYVIAFESSTTGGLREIEIRTRKPELRVKSRKWYSASSGE